MNPAVLLQLICDLQQKVMALFQANMNYEEQIQKLQEELKELKGKDASD